MSRSGDTKRAMLRLLMLKERTITGMAHELGKTTSTIAEHLEDLRQMNMVYLYAQHGHNKYWRAFRQV